MHFEKDKIMPNDGPYKIPVQKKGIVLLWVIRLSIIVVAAAVYLLVFKK